VRVFAVLSLLSATLAVGCFDCRPIETRALALECSGAATFRGELHLDSPDTFRSFLSDRCLTDATATEIDAVVASVDFTTEAVFVARGARGSIARCLESRAAESVDVCGDGLKVVFEDEESGDDVCPGDWTVAFALQRADLRAAIDD